MIINHTSNPNLFALVTDRSSNRPLMKKLSKLLGAINHLDGIDPETRYKLYEVPLMLSLQPKRTPLTRRQRCRQLSPRTS